MEPLVSIIVPVYNVEKYIEDCLQSLIHQTLKNIEIILVDDGSQDQSGSICDQYALVDSRIKVLHQSNVGLGYSRNNGMQIAKGDFIGFVDSDDYVSHNMFEVLYENAMTLKADISYCRWQKFCNSLPECKSENQEGNIQVWDNPVRLRQYLLDRVGMPPESKNDNFYGASVCCGIFKRTLIEENHICFVSEREFIAEDMIFDLNIIPCANCIVHTNAMLYFYRYNPSSLTTVYKPIRFEKNIELYEEMERLLAKQYELQEYQEPLHRYFITFSRIAVMQEVKFLKQNGFVFTYKAIKRICENECLQKILSIYSWKKLPWKYRVICALQKSKKMILLIVLLYLNNICCKK